MATHAVGTASRPRGDLLRSGWLFWRCLGAVDFSGDWGTAIGRSDIQFSRYTETENIKHFEERVVCKCTVRMLTGWIVATGHPPRNATRAHLSHS